MRPGDEVVEEIELVGVEADSAQILHQDRRIEDPDDHFLAETDGQGRQAELDLLLSPFGLGCFRPDMLCRNLAVIVIRFRDIQQGAQVIALKIFNLRPGDLINIPSGLSQEVYVLGEVDKPALFAYRENMPMSRVIAMAEGFTEDADLSRVHIMRGSLTNPTVIVSDFTRVVNGEAQDIRMEPGDVVYVPPTKLSSYARAIDKLVPTIQALQIGIILSGAGG